MRILVVSDSISLNTGYANTLKHIVKTFKQMGHEVHQIAWGLKEKDVSDIVVINDKIKYVNYEDVKLYITPQYDYHGKTIFAELVNTIIPHIVFTFGDIHTTAFVGLYPNRYFLWVSYYPVDSEKLTKAQAYIIRQVDIPIVYSKTGLYATLSATGREDTKLIYHGIDSQQFRKLDKETLKQQYGLKDKFVVGSCSRNNARKNFPALIKSFAKFAEGKNDVVLYLHTLPIDCGFNLYEFISECGIGDKVVITKDMNASHGVDIEDLVKVYNLFDVHVLTTTGEGLGLPILESQLCEVPTMVTDFSACKEFVRKNMRIDVKAFYYEPYFDCARAIIDEDDLVTKLNFYYNNQNMLPMIGEQCREYVSSWDWKYIEPLWKYLLIENGGKDSFGLSDDFLKL